MIPPVSPPPAAPAPGPSSLTIAAGGALLFLAFGTTGMVAFVRVLAGMFR